MATDLFKPVIYADDTVLSAALNMFGEINETLAYAINCELNNINDWFRVNKLSLNINKTKAMLFHHPNKQINTINIKINDVEIEFVEQFNYLGIILDSNLSWRPHIHAISQKISRTIGIMSKLKHIIPSETLLTLYNSLILPHLNYGILAWGIKCNRLFKLQKKSVRIILNSKYNAHTNPLFKKLQLLKVMDLCALQEFKFMYNFENKTLPNYFLSIQYHRHSSRHHYNTRNAENMELLPSRHVFVETSICYRLPKVLNTCPACIRDKIFSHSPKGFRNYVKNYFIGNYSEFCTINNCYICQG